MIEPLKAFAVLVLRIGCALSTLIDPEQRQRWVENASRTPPWDDRNRLIGKLIRPGQSVVDVGAGAQSLRRHLSPSNDYTPCDCVRSSLDIVICDLNRPHHLPKIGGFDVAVCSGVCEYLRYPRDVLRWVSRIAGCAILTYCPAEGGVLDRFDRLASGWLCHLSQRDFETRLRECWHEIALVDIWGRQRVYYCRKVRQSCGLAPVADPSLGLRH